MGVLGNKGGVLICDAKHEEGEQGDVLVAGEHWAPPSSEVAAVFERYDIFSMPKKERLKVADEVEAKFKYLQETSTPHLDDIASFAMKQICLHRASLLKSFIAWDMEITGFVPKPLWQEILSEHLRSVPRPLWRALSKRWGLEDDVNYISFLTRFRVRARGHLPRPLRLSVHHDSVDPKLFLASLARNRRHERGIIHFPGFEQLLLDWNLRLPKSQAAIWFDAIDSSLGRDVVLEDVVLGVILTSEIAQPASSQWYETALTLIGEQLTLLGQSPVDFYTSLDVDHCGSVPVDKVIKALKDLSDFPMVLAEEQFHELARFIDPVGMRDGGIGMVALLKAVTPAKLRASLSVALTSRSQLLPIFQHRAVLEAMLDKQNPTDSQIVSPDEFQEALRDMNRLKICDLTECQILAITDIAASCFTEETAQVNEQKIHYHNFLHSLEVVDAGNS